MVSNIILQLSQINVITGQDSTGLIVNKSALSEYVLTHDILAILFDVTSSGTTKTYLRAVVNKWTFHDKIMAEQYISFSISSETPINWAINDYCIFRGEVFTLNYIPSIAQKAGTGKSMESYNYDQVKMESRQEELTRCQLRDIVLTSGQHSASEGTNYTGSAVFELFCGETTMVIGGQVVTRTAVCTLADRIQANLNAFYGDNVWTVLVDTESTYIDATGQEVLVTHTENKKLTFDNNTVAEALAEVYNTFGLDYCVHGRVIKIGYEMGDVTADVDADQFAFGYGQGYPTPSDQHKALFEIRKTSDSSQKIVTRLRVLGSTKNLKYQYYFKKYNLSQALITTNLQLPDTFLPEGTRVNPEPGTKWANNTARLAAGLRAVQGAENDAYIEKNDDAPHCSEGIREATVRFDGSDKDLEEIYPSIEGVKYSDLRADTDIKDIDGNSGQNAFPNYGADENINTLLAIGYKHNGEMFDDANVGSGRLPDPNDTIIGEQKITYLAEDTKTLTEGESYYYGPETPLFSIENVARGKYFMVPVVGKEPYFNFSSTVSYVIKVGYIIRVKQTVSGVTSVIAEYQSDWFDNNGSVVLPTIPDVFNMDDARVPDITVTAPSNTTASVIVTFTPIILKTTSGLTYNLTYSIRQQNGDNNSTYVWAPVSNVDSSNQPFHVFVKDMGFDIVAQFTSEGTPKMVMKSGICNGMEFQIGESHEVITYDGKKGYMLTLYRADDTNLNTYYPSAGYQIAAGDEYVLTGIDLPDVYIEAAETRLLRAATIWLAENGDTRFRYQPSIDEIYLRRNYDNMVAAGTPEKSIFWRIYAGWKFKFADIPATGDDLEVKIESVSITMGEKISRKVDITLNDKTTQSTLKKTEATVKDLNTNMQALGNGMSVLPSWQAIRYYTNTNFLSKVHDDTSEGSITSKKNIQAMWGVSARGIVNLNISGRGGAGDVTGILFDPNVNYEEGEPYVASSGLISLPAYPTWNTLSGKPIFATVATSGSYNDLSDKPTIPTVNNGNLYLQVSGTTKVTFSANQSGNSTFNIAEGSADGTISVGGTNVSVHGLGTAAYKNTGTTEGTIPLLGTGGKLADSYISSASTWNAKQDAISDLSTIRTQAGEGHTAYGYFSDGILPITAGGTGASSASVARTNLGLGAAATYGIGAVEQNNGGLVTGHAVWSAIDNLPEPMVMKGTLGTNGTITDLPVASADNEGYTYKVITANTYQGQDAKVGDVFVSYNPTGLIYGWLLIPAGDTDSDTWRNIKVNGVELLGTTISTGALNFVSGTNVSVVGSGNDITISATNTASAVDNILKGSNLGTAITYAPYSSQQSKLSFDTSSTNPTRSDRLNLNGYLYATRLYSNGIQVVNLSDSQALTNKTYNGLTLAAATTGFTISGGTTSKTLTVNKNFTLNDACEYEVLDRSTAIAIANDGRELVTERTIYYGLPTINGAHNYTSNTNIYAPTGAGTSGQILKSTAGTPEWINQSSIVAGQAGRLSGNTTYSVWGAEYWSNGVPKSVTGAMSGVTNINTLAYFDTTYRNINVGTAASPANLQSFGGVSARGIVNLTVNGSGSAGTVTQVNINSVATAQSSGIVTISADGIYDATTNKIATQTTVSNAISRLNATISGMGTGKTLASLSESSGIISATFQDIAFPVTSVVGQTGGVTTAQIATALTNAGYKLTDTNTASAADDILHGTNSGTQITYAPYTSRQSGLSFYTGTTAPNGTTRLNLNGYLYATKLYSGGNEVLVSHQTIYDLTILDSDGVAQLNYDPTSASGAIQLTKAMVGLSNVENTKLSTWTGSANITTLGTITTGKWQGTAIADSYIASAATWNAKQNAISDLATIRSNASNGNTAYGYFSNGVLPASKGGTGKTSLTDAGSAIINALGEGSSNAQRDDYIVAQYAGGGTTTTTYHRRKLSKIFAALNSSDITTALGYTPYNSTNPNGYISGNQTITLSGDVSGSGATSIAVTIGAGKVTNAMLAGSIAISKISGLQTALDGKLATSLKGAANGLAELDSNGLVPSSQLPSYVDDVLEYASKSAFPATGTSGKIYVALDTNLTYRWSGSAYVEISPSLALGETSSTAYRGDRGKTAYTHATDASRLTTAKSSGFYKFATTAEGHIASVTAVSASDLTGLLGTTYVTGMSWDSTNNKLAWSKGGTAQTAITIGYATSAGTASKVGSSTVGSSSVPIYLNSGTATAVSFIDHSYVSFTGRSLSGSTSVLDKCFEDRLRANSLASFASSTITIERSSDGGNTWTAVDYSAANKLQLFRTESDIRVVASGNATTANQLRITLNAERGVDYIKFTHLLIQLATEGATMKCEVSTAPFSAPTTFSVIRDAAVSGWTDWNSLNASVTAGGFSGDTRDYSKYIRFRFYITGVSSSYTNNFHIKSIRGLGGWDALQKNNLSYWGRIYTYDGSLNAAFPARVSATSFTENGTALSSKYLGINANAVSATKATQDNDGTAFKGNYLRKVSVPNNTENDFNTFESMTMTGRGDPTTGASLVHAPWSGGGPAGGYGTLTYSWGGYGTQMAWGYNDNHIYIRKKIYNGSTAAWSDSWSTVALTSDNVASATKATNDSDGNAINTTYLKKSGGIVTGTTTFQSDNFGEALTVKRNDTNSATIRYSNANGVIAYLGFTGGATKELKWWDSGINPHVIWHDANDGSGSGLDADLLDGQHGSYYAVKAASKGSTTKPIYTDANGAFQECSTYAGGTKVTLNNSDKGESTASFYAPTGGGTQGYLLKANGATSTPTWAAPSDISVGSATRLVGTSSYSAWGRTFWQDGQPQSVVGDMTNVGNIDFVTSGKNIAGLLYFDKNNRYLNVGTSSAPAHLRSFGGVSARGITELTITGASLSGMVSQINVGNTSYLPTNGVVTLPDSFPASDVYTWAKAASRPSYSTTIVGSTETAATTLNFGSKYQLSAGDTSCIFALASLPTASTSAAGIAQLSSAVDSTSETVAATAAAVKAAYDHADTKAARQLSTSTSSASSLTMQASTDSTYVLWSSSSVTAVSLAQSSSTITTAYGGVVHYMLFRNTGSSNVTVTMSKYNNSNYYLIAPAKSFVIPANSSVEISYVHIIVGAARYTVVTIGDVMSDVS